jgi:hypothetical protein
MAQGMKYIALDFTVTFIQRVQQIFDELSRGLSGTGAGIGNFREVLPSGKGLNSFFFQQT